MKKHTHLYIGWPEGKYIFSKFLFLVNYSIKPLNNPTIKTTFQSHRQKIIKEKAVPKIEGYMFEEHDMVRAAATECMCNLALSTEVHHMTVCVFGPDRDLNPSEFVVFFDTSGAEGLLGYRQWPSQAAGALQWWRWWATEEGCVRHAGHADRRDAWAVYTYSWHSEYRFESYLIKKSSHSSSQIHILFCRRATGWRSSRLCCSAKVRTCGIVGRSS